jgi:peptidoglycan/xylan/chitin deacetylase (PgdA/CDA1 family)
LETKTIESSSVTKKRGVNRTTKVVASIILLSFVGYFSWHFAKYHKVPIDPTWLLRRVAGVQNYDPDSGILYHGNPNIREVALTIDDGPNPKFGPGIIDTLHKYNCPATFFVVGIRVRQYPNIIREMVDDGDEIGNHTYDHQRLPALKPHEIAAELRDDDNDIFRATGIHTRIMRPPGMEYSHKVLTVVKAMGYRTVSWTVAAKDFLNQKPSFIEQRVEDRIEPGSIILLHQDTPYTQMALPTIITSLRSRGYKFVTISTLLKDMNAPPLNNKPPKNEPWDSGLGQE